MDESNISRKSSATDQNAYVFAYKNPSEEGDDQSRSGAGHDLIGQNAYVFVNNRSRSGAGHEEERLAPRLEAPPMITIEETPRNKKKLKVKKKNEANAKNCISSRGNIIEPIKLCQLPGDSESEGEAKTKPAKAILIRRKNAEAAKKTNPTTHGEKGKMDLERESRFVEENIAAARHMLTKRDWINGRRMMPAVKRSSSGPENEINAKNCISRGGDRQAERANITNTIKRMIHRETKERAPRNIKPLRARGPTRFVYSAMIDKNGKATRATTRRRYIIVDSASQTTLVRDEAILNMLKARDAKGDRISIKGFTSATSMPVTIAAPVILPFEGIEAYYDESFPENILAMEALENIFEVTIVKSDDSRYLKCVNNVNGEVIRCFRDPAVRNFYTYCWDDNPDTVCFKISSTLTKAQRLGLSKIGAIRALEVEAIHKALSHCSCETLRKTFREGVFADNHLNADDVDNFEKFIGCTGCDVGKKIREKAVITDPQKPSNAIGVKVHADIFNISSEDPNFKTINFLMTTDDFSGYSNIVPLVNSTSAEAVRGLKLVVDIYKKAGHEIKTIRSDNGGGFTADATKKALDAMHVSTVPVDDEDYLRAELLTMAIDLEHCTAQSHVRVVERAIRHAKELFRATIFDLPYLLPNKFYGHVMVYVASSINLTINSKNDVRCPWQLMHGEAPRSHDFLRSSFGQLVTTYNQLNPNKRSDDSIRADVGIVVGRDSTRKGSFYVYDIHTKSIVSRHDVTPIGWNQNLLNNFHAVNDQKKSGASVRFSYGSNERVSSLIDLQEKRKQIVEDAKLRETDSVEDLRAYDSQLAAITTYAYAVKLTAVEDEEAGYRAEIENVLSAFNISIKKSIEIVGEEATEEAALKEIDALLKLNVFKFLNREELQGLLKDRVNFITSQMLMKQKYDASNVFEKNKARLIAHGNQQIFDEVFASRAESPTININIVFAGIAIAAKASSKVEMQVIDIDNAYLNASLATPEYMYIGKDVATILCKHHPEYREFIMDDGRLAVELQKALYGLRTAGRDWYNLISTVLQDAGYTRSDMDKCLFIHGDKTQIFLYVDDLLIIGIASSIAALKIALIEKFKSIKVKEGSQLSYLGMAIEKQLNGDIHVHQRGYIENMAKEYGCESTSKYPSNANILHEANKHEDMTAIDGTKYLSLAMKLMFVVVRCRPDALFPTTILAARCQQPTVEDYNRLLKIVKYLHGTKDQSLIFRHDTPIKPRMYVDASFQTHRDAKGHSGFVLFLDEGSAGVMFKSKKQQSVSDSSAEAELISLHEGVRQLIWMSLVLEELGVTDQYPIDVFQDNKSTIQMASNERINFRGRSKFIDRKYFSIYQHVESGKINLVFVGTELMVADFFTKAIVGKQFEALRFSIMGGPQV